MTLSYHEQAENFLMRHSAKSCMCRASTLGSNLLLSPLHGEAIRRLGSKRCYFEELKKSLTLMALEGSLPWQGGVWHQGLQWRKCQPRCEKLESVQQEKAIRLNLNVNIKKPVQKYRGTAVRKRERQNGAGRKL